MAASPTAPAGVETRHATPEKVADLEVNAFNSGGRRPSYTVRSLSGGTYIRTGRAGVMVLELLDGRSTAAEIGRSLESRHCLRLPPEKIETFIDICERNGLLKPGTWRPTGGRREARRRSPLKFCRTLFKGEALLDFLLRRRSWWLNRVAAALWCVLLVAAVVFAASSLGGPGVAAPLYLFEGGESVLLPALILPILALEIGLHELAHGLACRLNGISAGGFGGGLLWGILPVFYTDTAEAYRVDNKYRRALISAAGPMADIAFLGLFALLGWLSPGGSGLERFAHSYAALPLSFLLINLNPFILRMDGYWIVSDLLEQPNLRTMARHYLQSRLRGLSGLRGGVAALPLGPPEERGWRVVYVVYGLISISWTAVFLTLFVWSAARGVAHFAQAVAR
jgi:putative peptide zinc metalloprotease protein